MNNPSLDDPVIDLDIDPSYEPNMFAGVDPFGNIEQCSSDVLGSLPTQTITLLFFVLLQRCVSQTYFPNWAKHLAITAMGAYTVYDFYPHKHLLQVIGSGTMLILLLVRYGSMPYKGHMIALLAITSVFALEFVAPEALFMSTRGMLMILVMKLISLGYDFERIHLPLLDSFSFLLNPASVIFGPFSQLQYYKQSLKPSNNYNGEFRRFVRGTCWILVSLCSLIISSCVFENFLRMNLGSCANDYFVALSFRVSHYFIMFLSQGLWHLSDASDEALVSPIEIEWPRSISQVVRAWNEPMHYFLKQYIFKKWEARGTTFAMFSTFLFSSLLHGLDVQITAVLMSLAFISYAEYRFRERLAELLSAPVMARNFSYRRGYRNNENSLICWLVNFIFTVVNVYHLVYLGIVFDGSAENGKYHWKHAISIWEKHYFASHGISLALFLLSFVF